MWAAYQPNLARSAQEAGVEPPELKKPHTQFRYKFDESKQLRIVPGTPATHAARQVERCQLLVDLDDNAADRVKVLVHWQRENELVTVQRGIYSEQICRPIGEGKYTMKRGALDAFFKAAVPKKPKYEVSSTSSHHAAYPIPIPHLPAPFMEQLGFAPEDEGKVMVDQLHLDMVYYQPYIPSSISSGIFDFLRQELPFYRVQYTITRFGTPTQINTPRYTTVFGIDDTSRFDSEGKVVDAKTGKPADEKAYKCVPRPIPQCLDELRKVTEGTTGETFNFCLVNYYADGKDSISYHSDDERFLGADPAIASFSLGAKRDFLMKHKPIEPKDGVVVEETKPIKLPLGSGDMVLMRGKTQSNWLHSIPKRANSEGRINITFRKAMVKGGTENYYQYNVGTGGVFRWNAGQKKMAAWGGEAQKVEEEGVKERSARNGSGSGGGREETASNGDLYSSP